MKADRVPSTAEQRPSVRRSLLRAMAILLAAGGGLSCDDTRGYREEKEFAYFTFPTRELKCLDDHSSQQMADLFVDLFFPPSHDVIDAPKPITLWLTRSPASRAPGVFEDLRNRYWPVYKEDVRRINTGILRMAYSADPNYLSKKHSLRVTFFLQTEELGESLLRGYAPPTPQKRSKMESFLESGEMCSYWRGIWKSGSYEFDQLNVFVSASTEDPEVHRPREAISHCLVEAVLSDIGFQNRQALADMQLVEKNEYGSPVLSDYSRWLFGQRFRLADDPRSLSSRARLRAKLDEILKAECRR